VSVSPTDPPKAEFTYSPTDPRFGQEVFFNASSSSAAAGQTIVYYDWDFGTGRGGQGRTVSKRYGTDLIPPGAISGDEVTFIVTLTVSDSTFSPTGVATTSKPVKIVVP
jgi:hypothetical protein